MDTRVEKKFIINNNIKNNEFINLFSGNFFEANPSRIVNSIYFDTPDLKSFFDNIEGLENRFKVRIRWYNNNVNQAKIEIKVKQGLFGKKIIYDLNNFTPQTNLWEYLKKINLYSDISMEYIPYLINLIPISYNSYTRKYFESFNKKIRITLDTNLKFKKLNNFKLPKENQMRSLDYSILELKYKDSDQEEVTKMLKNTPLILRKFSKYTAGAMAS
jgi:SPX domain protein involved in polyphosphate accumulation